MSKKTRPTFGWGFNMPKKEDTEKVKSNLMPTEEALNILQLNSNFTQEQVEERFTKLFNLNDPVKGGSYYIQCKVMGAKLSLMKHLDDLANPGKKENVEETKEENKEEIKDDEGKSEEKSEKNEKSEKKSDN